MSFKKNTAVTGFTFGLVSATDGSDITTGTPAGYVTLDGGTQTAIGDVTPVHEGNGQWSFDLTAAEMNGDIVGLVFTHTSAITVHFTIKTETKLVSELNDVSTTQVNAECDTAITDAALATAAALATVDSIVDSILVDTAEIGVAGAGLTNIGTIATVTNLTNLPTIPANWLTAAGIATSALDGKGDWNIGKTGYTLTQSFPANFADMSITVTTGQVTVGTNNDKTGYTASTVSDKTGYSISGTKTTLDALNDIAATDIVSAGAITTLSGAVVNVDLVDTCTTNTDMRGTDSAALATALADVPTVAEFNARTLVAGDYFDPAADTVTLAGTQGAITWGAQTVSVAGATSNITLAGSGTGDCLTFTRSGSGNLFDTNWSSDLRAEVATELATYDGPTNAEMEARTPTAAQLAYMVENANTGLPVTFTTAGGSTTTAVLNLVDGSAGSATNDQYNGRLLVFTDGTLKGVVTDITDYVGSTTTATITAIPTAPTASHNARLI